MLGSRGGVRAGMADVGDGGARRYNGTLGGDDDGGGAQGRWARAVGGAGDGGGTRRR